MRELNEVELGLVSGGRGRCRKRPRKESNGNSSNGSNGCKRRKPPTNGCVPKVPVCAPVKVLCKPVIVRPKCPSKNGGSNGGYPA